MLGVERARTDGRVEGKEKNILGRNDQKMSRWSVKATGGSFFHRILKDVKNRSCHVDDVVVRFLKARSIKWESVN